MPGNERLGAARVISLNPSLPPLSDKKT